MKASTNIHAGDLSETAQPAAATVAQAAQSAAGGLGEFFNTAQNQAEAVVDGAAGIFTGFWDGLTGLFS